MKDIDSIIPSQLSNTATLVRCFLEPIWLQWHEAIGSIPPITSQGTCGRSSLFLQRVLADHGIASQWITGGNHCSHESSGFYANGTFHNHSWLLVEDDWIVDITADQFNEAPILIVPKTDGRYYAGQYDSASPIFIQKRHETVDNLWKDWVLFKEKSVP